MKLRRPVDVAEDDWPGGTENLLNFVCAKEEPKNQRKRRVKKAAWRQNGRREEIAPMAHGKPLNFTPRNLNCMVEIRFLLWRNVNV